MCKRKSFFKKAMAMFLVFTLVFVAMPPAHAESLQDQLNNIEKQIKEQQEILAKAKSEKEIAEAQVANGQKQVDVTQSQINAMVASIQAKEEEIAQKQAELDQKKAEFAQTEELFMQRMRAMYMMQDGSVLGTLLGATSFEDFIMASDNMQRVSDEDQETLALLLAQKEEIERQQAVLDAELEDLEAQKVALDAKKAQYLQQLTAYKGVAAAKEEDYQMELNTFNSYVKAKMQIYNDLHGTSDEYVGGEFTWPVPGYGYISSPYGYRPNPWGGGGSEFHNGIDISRGSKTSIAGVPIVASNTGTVIRAAYNAGGYGYYIIIDHGGGKMTVYGHCSQLYVSVGQVVAQGETIAAVGSTGNSTGPHLHFEIRINGSNVDPEPYLVNRPSSR